MEKRLMLQQEENNKIIIEEDSNNSVKENIEKYIYLLNGYINNIKTEYESCMFD